jgi:hypothetical protein
MFSAVAEHWLVSDHRVHMVLSNIYILNICSGFVTKCDVAFSAEYSISESVYMQHQCDIGTVNSEITDLQMALVVLQ